MVNSLENIDKSKVYVDRIEGLDEVVSDVISDTLTGAVSTITTSDLTAGKVLVSDSNGKVAASSDVLSNLVHKTGNETITGDKSFNSSNDYHYIHIGNTSHSYDETVNNSLYSGIIFEDKNNTEAGFVRRIQNSTDNMLQLGIKGKDGTLNQSFLGIDSSGNKYMTAPTPTDTTTTSGNQVATTGWVNSTGNNVIHKTNDETISGVKTFTGDGWITKIQNTDVTYNTAPSSIKPTSIIFTDKNGTQMGCVECQRYPNNNTLVRFNAYSPNGNWASQTLELMIDANDNVSASAPTPTDTTTTTGTQIATTGWVNSVGNNVVHLTDYENITGYKSFQTNIEFDSPNMIQGTNGSGYGIEFYDKNLNRFGFLRPQAQTNANVLSLCATRIVNGQIVYSAVDATVDSSGNCYVKAPASDVNGSVVTTVNKSKAANGYFQLGNGLIINWGTQTHSSAAVTVTFAKAFTSTNYAVTAILNTTSASTTERYCPIVYSKSKTGCTIWIKGTEGNISWHAIGY